MPGDEDGTWRTLDDAYAQRRKQEPEWVWWLNRNEIDVMAGRCLTELGRPREAESLLSAVIANYPAEHARVVALCLSRLAQSDVRTGDLDAAREVLGHARRYAASMPSPRAEERIAAVERLLA
jgi:hypothetical protein